MPQVPREVAKARAQTLREIGAARLRAHLDAQTGRTITILTERGGAGRAEDFTPVAVEEREAGLIFTASVAGHDGERLRILA
jgi:threonylcarbamoyladenosine tRNA methylthiotransferase MtaB